MSNVISSASGLAYVGVVAGNGYNGDTLFSLTSFGVNTCGGMQF
jgi:hypothetical protein